MTVTTNPTNSGPDTRARIDSDVLIEAIANGVVAVEPRDVGEHGKAFVLPPGYKVDVVDVRDSEDLPRYREGDFAFVGIPSFTDYVNRYRTGDTLLYVKDVYGLGARTLVNDTRVLTAIVDDIPASEGTARRKHIAALVFRPTTAARRWGAVLSGQRLDQEAMLDLVVDGLGEIAEPDGAELRDLISDLHAVRTTTARSVKRTGGQATVELAENVTLHSGPGNTVEIPERMSLVFEPFAGIPGRIVLDVTIKPSVPRDGGVVTFVLSAPQLDDKVARIVGDVSTAVGSETGMTPLWTP